MPIPPPPPRAIAPVWTAALLVPLFVGAGAGDPPPPWTFEVTYSAAVHPGPISGRVCVFLGKPGDEKEPRLLDEFPSPGPVFSVDARDWRPGEPLRVGPGARSFLGPLDAWPKDAAPSAQAVIRLNPDTHSLGRGAGNGYGLPVPVPRDAQAPVRLTIDRTIQPKPFPRSGRIQRVEVPSPLLSKFHGRPIHHRAAVILPEGDPGRKRPVLYIVPGFGGDLGFASQMLRDPRFAFGREMIRVVLDPDCGTGHHVFADSVTNGPRGRALVEELIPHLENVFPALATASARRLYGHSSGGWTALRLQVTYPEAFGGAWSTSPDPVDFREFQGVNLYEPGVNLYRDPRGDRRPLARAGARPILYYDEFARREEVLGDGGQLGSFEAVFSPLGPDGRPRPLWDRATGAVDPETARAWESFDLRLILERNWETLGPRLAGRLHVIVGAIDTFYLEGGVQRLKASLARLGSDAIVEIVTGKDHFTLLTPELAARFDREMTEKAPAPTTAPH